MEELEIDHALTHDVSTPHINWAHPYAGGKIRVLFFTDGRGTNPRECVEMMQRFDIEAAAVFHARIVDSSKEDWHGGKEGVKRMTALMEKEWDVFVFLGISPEIMPETLREEFLAKVQAGLGVVLSGVVDPVLLAASTDRKGTDPFLLGINGARAFSPGKGHAVWLPARPALFYAEGWQNTYETWQENLGRAVLWAAGKIPQSQFSIVLSKNVIPQSESSYVQVKWSGAVIGDKPRLQLWIRKPLGWLAPWPDRDLAVGETLEMYLPRLPSGRYHLDGRVVSSTGVENWATIPFEVTSPRRISDIKLEPGWGEVGGEITGSVSLVGPSTSDEKIRVAVLDKDHRILLQQDFVGKGDQVVFSFDIPSWMPMLSSHEASVMSRDNVLSSSSRHFHVNKRNRDRFNFLMWDVPRGTLAPYAEEMLALTGVTLQLAQGNPLSHVAAHDIAWIPYTTRILAKLNDKGIMTPFCWNDTAIAGKTIQSLADRYQPSRQHGVFAYSLGDEVATQGACLAETCMEAYRGYLKAVYGALAALNRSWGTDFKTWETVGLSALEDNEEKLSLEARNYPRWFDRQAFKSWNFVQYAKKYAAAYVAMDSQARTGFEGAGRFDRGDDIDLIVRCLGFWSPYPGTTDEVIRSIAPRGFPRANWMGYQKDADPLLQKYWRMVTRGMDSVWWWRWDCIGKFHGWLAPDLRPYQAVKEILADTRPVREGLGDLLLKSRMEDDGIAILYSYPSTFAHRLEEGRTYGGYEKSHVAWHKAIRELGLQFSYVTDRMLRLGEFDAGRFRVLVLPRAEAIGEKEAAVIRSFVEGGGVVIADTRPGIYDDHCKRQDTGILDDLFGVRRKGFPQARKVSGAIVDPGIEVVNGTARENFGQTLNSEVGTSPQFSELARAPVLIGRRVGKGYALLINGDLNVLTAAKAEGLGTLLERLAGVRPTVRLLKEDWEAMQNLEAVRWRNGKNEILAFFRQGGQSEKAKVTLPRDAQVYDLRQRKALGMVKTFSTTILPNRASFFVLTPEAAPPVQVVVRAEKLGSEPPMPARIVKAKGSGHTAYASGTLVKARLSVPGAQGDHAVLVTARFPKPPAEPLRCGAFFPRTGYPVMPAEFRKGDTSGNTGTNPHKQGTVPNLPAPDVKAASPDDFVYPGVDPEKGEFLKRVVIIGRESVTVDVPVAFNDPTGVYELTVTDLFTQKTVTRTWRVNYREATSSESQKRRD